MIPTIEEVCTQCRIDQLSSGEEGLLRLYVLAARKAIENYTNMKLVDTESEIPEGMDPANVLLMDDGVKLAILLLVGHWYAHRECVSDAGLCKVPLSFDLSLCRRSNI
nr:head-tail connector protein [Plesiomonas shigelloides]